MTYRKLKQEFKKQFLGLGEYLFVKNDVPVSRRSHVAVLQRTFFVNSLDKQQKHPLI